MPTLKEACKRLDAQDKVIEELRAMVDQALKIAQMGAYFGGQSTPQEAPPASPEAPTTAAPPPAPPPKPRPKGFIDADVFSGHDKQASRRKRKEFSDDYEPEESESEVVARLAQEAFEEKYEYDIDYIGLEPAKAKSKFYSGPSMKEIQDMIDRKLKEEFEAWKRAEGTGRNSVGGGASGTPPVATGGASAASGGGGIPGAPPGVPPAVVKWVNGSLGNWVQLAVIRHLANLIPGFGGTITAVAGMVPALNRLFTGGTLSQVTAAVDIAIHAPEFTSKMIESFKDSAAFSDILVTIAMNKWPGLAGLEKSLSDSMSFWDRQSAAIKASIGSLGDQWDYNKARSLLGLPYNYAENKEYQDRAEEVRRQEDLQKSKFEHWKDKKTATDKGMFVEDKAMDWLRWATKTFGF